MFCYRLPNGLRTKTYRTPEGQIKFSPPVYEQRYTTAIRILTDPLWRLPIKKVVDFGCSEMSLLQLLRRVPSIEHVLEVDIDEQLLVAHQQKAVPLISDYIAKRETPLRVEVLHGSLIDAVEQLYDVDAVIALEVIEHLYSDVLEKVPENIFGFIQPKLAIFSTPNSEFNVLFDSMPANGFRHSDHKFEWTRKEFETWAQNICVKYQNYSVAFMGLGESPEDNISNIGHSTQLAIFARQDNRGLPLTHKIVKRPPNEGARYKIIYAVDFPYNKDERSKDQKILDEAKYLINKYRYNAHYFNEKLKSYLIPWHILMEYTKEVGSTEAELLEILKSNEFTIDGDFIVLPEYDSDEYSDDEIEPDSETDKEQTLSENDDTDTWD